MYNPYFGFSGSPFENTLDQRFLFLGEEHQEVLAALLYFIETKKGFALVCGDVGTGKTMLLNSLLEQLPETVSPVLIANPYVSSQELLLYLAYALGIKATGAEKVLELTDAVKNALLEAKSRDRHLILIVDEAHLLSDQALEEIRLLSNIETPTQKLLQILLVGQYELSHNLDRPEMRHLRQRINVNRFLAHLNPADTITYIDHRLHQVGSSFASVFEGNCRRLIFKLTRGVPRSLNQLCDNALLICMAEGRRQVNRRTLKQAHEALQADRLSTPKGWIVKVRVLVWKYCRF
jgi:general secretion pathway protein A